MNTVQMKTAAFFLVIVSVMPALGMAQLSLPDPGIRIIDFSGEFSFLSEAPVERIEGSVPGATGVITTNTTDLSQTTGTIVVPVAGMKTGNKTRDKHVVSKHWLDGKKYPEISFDIQKVSVSKIDDSGDIKVAELIAEGIFSMHGRQQPMNIPMTLKWKGSAVKITSEFNVALADYGVEGKKGVVGKRVGTSIKLKANLKGSVRE